MNDFPKIFISIFIESGHGVSSQKVIDILESLENVLLEADMLDIDYLSEVLQMKKPSLAACNLIRDACKNRLAINKLNRILFDGRTSEFWLAGQLEHYGHRIFLSALMEAGNLPEDIAFGYLNSPESRQELIERKLRFLNNRMRACFSNLSATVTVSFIPGISDCNNGSSVKPTEYVIKVQLCMLEPVMGK